MAVVRKPTRGMYTKHFAKWQDFFLHLQQGYLTWEYDKRDPLLFRGQSNDSWPITPSIDRFWTFNDVDHRNEYAESLNSQYADVIQRLHDRRIEDLFNENELEMHARHHGVPTRLLDWTRSPFVAAYFAFYGLLELPKELHGTNVSIFRYAPNRITNSSASAKDFEVIECDGRANPRAWAQKSVFIRLLSNNRSFDKIAAQALSKYTIPVTEVKTALTWLMEMGVTPEVLFPDHDGAAKLIKLKSYPWETLE